MGHRLLPCEGDDLFGESKLLREELLAFVVDEIVEILPVEDKLDQFAVLERAEKSANVDIWHIGALVRL